MILSEEIYMTLGQYLVVRGAIIGSIVLLIVCLLASGSLMTTDAASMDENTAIGTHMQADLTGDCRLNPAYPPAILQWCDVITRAAHANGLQPNLVAAVTLQESGGDPMAYSRSGAVGLMQVMPRDGLASTFNCVNGPCFANRPTIQELQDPAFNVEYGTHLLASLVQKYGSLREALRAYGPADAGYIYADIVLGIYERYK